MSLRIQLPAQAVARLAEESPGAQTDDAAKVGREFEAIFVRQMLSSTKVAGKGGGYADMAVEALASSITAAGGLGMGRAIEEALTAHTAAARPRAPSALELTDATEKGPPAPQVHPGAAVRRVGP